MSAPHAPVPPAPQQAAPVPPKFGGLAWTALILGIVGVLGSWIPLLNNVTAVAAGVGFVLGVIALFGTKKVIAAIGVLLCVLAIVFTVIAQNAFVKAIDDAVNGPSSSDAAGAPKVYAVGETATGSKTDITLSKPRSFTTSAMASPGGVPAIGYDVTIVNHGDQAVPPMSLSITASVGDKSSEQVFDSGGGYPGAPTTDLLPGKSVTFPVAFVDNGGEVLVQFSAFFDGDKVYFKQQR